MKSLQLSLIVVFAVVALLGSSLWVMAQAVPSDPAPTAEGVDDTAQDETASISQETRTLIVTATVGTTQNSCSPSTTAFVRGITTTVYYCFLVHNRHNEPLTLHRLQMSRRSFDLELGEGGLTVQPNSIGTLRQLVTGQFITDSTSVDVTNFITWTARPSDGEPQFVATSRARINVVTPSVRVLETVGQDRTSCPTARTVRVPSGQSVAFCISIENTGNVTLTRHTINAAPFGINNVSIPYTLAPQAVLNIYPSNQVALGISANTSLERSNVTAAFASNVSYSGTGPNDLTATGTSTASVEIGTSTVRITKTVSTQAEDCSKNNSITLNPGTMVYYCVIIQNTGVVTLTQHRLTENYLSIDVSFNYPLRPGQRLEVTNEFLAANNQPIVFGPFEVHPKYGSNDTIENTMNYTGISDDGFAASASGGATVTYPNTPTRTNTPRPDPTSTSTPPFTSTPTDTPIPQSPTPTVTPTFTPETPSPTPTRSYAISLLQTPTPRVQPANIPNAPQQQDPFATATVDPNQPFSPLPDPNQNGLPVQDPFLATATQIAVDATATVIAAEATAAQAAIQNAAATALAESQAPLPESPLSTPTIDPSLPDPNQAGLPMTETPEPTTTLVLRPGEELTVLPPMVTAELTPQLVTPIATPTPEVIYMVVTNTPQGGAVLPEGQRPIVPPTATPTPDFVMAAARTFDMAVTTMGWLWFLVGSLIFFVTAGIVAGLFFRQSEANRYELPQPDYWLEEEPPANRPRDAKARDDEWPADLP